MVIVAVLAGLPGALGGHLRIRRQPLPERPADGIEAAPATSLLAFGGEAFNPMTTEELENLPSPGDMANSAIAASTIGSLQASLQGSAVPPAPPLVETESSPPAAVDDAPAPDDDSTAIEDDADAAPPDAVTAPTESDLPSGAMDMMVRATHEVDRQAATITQAKPAKSPPLVSMVVCAKAAKAIKAMSCSLVTQISGYPEGCECRMKAKKCPAVRKDLGFTGVSPSIPFSPPQLGGVSVILCMYWQWLKPQDRSEDATKAAYDTRELANEYVKVANDHATALSKVVATQWYAATAPPTIIPTTIPIPATPAPIFEPVRFLSTTPYMPFFGNWAPGPAPGPYPGPAPGPAPGFVPFMPMFSAQGVASTSLMLAAWAGTYVLAVMSPLGFQAGQQVMIAQGTPAQEVGQIVRFGSLILAAPLRFNHGPGTTVRALVGAPAPGPSPAPSPGPGFAPAGAPWAAAPGGFGFPTFQASPWGALFAPAPSAGPAPGPAPALR